jgi:hypothetical protein
MGRKGPWAPQRCGRNYGRDGHPQRWGGGRSLVGCNKRRNWHPQKWGVESALVNVERAGEKRAAWAKTTSWDGLPVCSVPAKDCGAVGKKRTGAQLSIGGWWLESGCREG